MVGRETFGKLLVWAGTASLAIALFHLLDIPACGEVEPCPPGTGKWIAMMAFGIGAPIAGSFLARSPLLQFALGIPALAVMFLLKAFLDRGPGERTGLLVAAGILSALTVLGVRGAFRASAKQLRIKRLVDTGSKARGVVVGVRDTGIEINNHPRIVLEVRLEPLDGTAPWEDEKKMTVSKLAIPREGQVFPVWFDPADPAQWAIGVPSGEQPVDPELLAQFDIDPAGDDDVDDRVESLERLAKLREDGVLTEDEFVREKRRILGDEHF